MEIIPAIDIKNGQCVRLRQGRMDDVTVFSEDPVAMARHWLELGAPRLHLVDLDGAIEGRPRNAALIESIAAAAGSVPVQVGGGVRDEETIAGYLDSGVTNVVIGTRAVEEPEFFARACRRFPHRLMLGIDARDGYVATHGWEHTTRRHAEQFARWASELPLVAIVYTDIARDGMLGGLNLEATLELAESCGVPVIASGGIRDLDSVRALYQASRGSHGVVLGMITGRALYEGSLDLEAALAMVS